MRLPGAPSPVGTIYYVTRAATGEEALGLRDENLNECGFSYEDGGYKWNTRSLY
jgi:hypothetical protein